MDVGPFIRLAALLPVPTLGGPEYTVITMGLLIAVVEVAQGALDVKSNVIVDGFISVFTV